MEMVYICTLQYDGPTHVIGRKAKEESQLLFPVVLLTSHVVWELGFHTFKLESPLDCKEITSVHPKGDPFWIFIGRTDAKAETPILWQPHVKSWLIWKDPNAGKDWKQEEKGTTEDEMVGWYHWLDGHEFE